MLVLTRKVGEAVRIGVDVTVQVLEVRGGQVRLGLTAPSDIRILREEVLRSMESANGAASRGHGTACPEPPSVLCAQEQTKRTAAAGPDD